MYSMLEREWVSFQWRSGIAVEIRNLGRIQRRNMLKSCDRFFQPCLSEPWQKTHAHICAARRAHAASRVGWKILSHCIASGTCGRPQLPPSSAGGADTESGNISEALRSTGAGAAEDIQVSIFDLVAVSQASFRPRSLTVPSATAGREFHMRCSASSAPPAGGAIR